MTIRSLCAFCVVTSLSAIAAPPEESEQGFRAQLKCAIDSQARSIQTKPTPTTIAEIRQQKTPRGVEADGGRERAAEKRFAPFETKVWQVEATLTQIQILEDGDLMFVLRDPSGKSVVCEIPGFEEVERSPLRAKIVAARKTLEKGLGPHRQPMLLRQKIVVEGVGHFGSRNTRDERDNGARLIPIVGVKLIGKPLPPHAN